MLAWSFSTQYLPLIPTSLATRQVSRNQQPNPRPPPGSHLSLTTITTLIRFHAIERQSTYAIDRVSVVMDDLLNTFAGQNIAPPPEENHQNHFTDVRLTRLEHPMPIDPITASPPGPNLESPTEEEYKYHFLDDSLPGSEHAMPINPAAATSAKDPFFEDEASGVQGQRGTSFEDEADYNADIDDIDDDNEEYGPEEMTDEVGYVRVTEATEAASHKDLNEFAQHLRRLHRQDMERDEVFTVSSISWERYLLSLDIY